MLKLIKKILPAFAIILLLLPLGTAANAPASSGASGCDYITYGGSEYEPGTFSTNLVVGQTGQIRRPQNSPLKDSLLSFDMIVRDPSILSFDEQGNWVALKEGKTTVFFGMSYSQAFSDELDSLGLGDLGICVKEIASYLEVTVSAAETPMHRLYNPNTSEHFYTANPAEKNHLVHLGWSYEGIGWYAPTTGQPVYRLYNPNTGDHHYTTSKGESDYLNHIGWNYEGVAWYSGGDAPIHRLYNPNAKTGSHHYTLSKGESDYLDHIGWNYEGIGWYAVK